MKISIITVSFNSAKTIRDTIESVLSQAYPDIEYIVVDGNSKDDTVNIIREYEPRFNGRMRWVSEPDKGLYDAMNKGIRMATGDVVGIINSDDFFTDKEVIEKIANAFKKEDIDAVYGDIHFVSPLNLKKRVRYYSSAVFRRALMRFGLIPAHPSFYLRRSCFEKYGYYSLDYDIAADFEFLLRLIFVKCIRIKYLPIDMVTMRTGGKSTSGWKVHRSIMKEHLRAFRENGIYTNPLFLSLRYFYKIYELIRR